MFSFFDNATYQNEIIRLNFKVYKLKKRVAELEATIMPDSERVLEQKFDFVDFILTYGIQIGTLSILTSFISGIISLFSPNIAFYHVAQISSWVFIGFVGLWVIFTGIGRLQSWFDEKMKNK